MTTAVLKVQTKHKGFIRTRALLDSCSTVNLITEKLSKLLHLPTKTCLVNIGAVDKLSTVSKHYVKVTFYSIYNNIQHDLNFLIVPNITDVVPNEVFPRNLFDIPKNLQLADPQFHIPQSVDMLLASNTTLSILAVGQIKLRHNDSEIILQKTSLGWIVAGGVQISTETRKTSCNVVKLDKLIERFWLIEDFDHEPIRSRDEVACELHYVTHTKRDDTGRYIVRLPFRDSKFNLGESRQQALKRFYALERKFNSNPSLKTEYTKIMEEYISLGHMTLCDENEGGYFLPHHAVFKESSETTKVRVVFDASAKTSTGISLNDTLMVGPTIQNTIFEQTLRFRIHIYVITADIEKMYRQILIDEADRIYQKVLWFHQNKLKTFKLNTVTFGTAAAPFLAIRTIQQLSRDEAHEFPRVSKLLLRDFYVDDFITGADSLDEIITIRDEMIALLLRGGFHIRQWASNHPSALNAFNKQIYDLDCMVKKDPIQKTLGIIWDSQNDRLQYTLNHIDPQVTVTKRKLLSELSKIFDPLGLLGPVTLYAKCLIQDCWKSKITWDESLPQEVHTKWKGFAKQLSLLKNVFFPRQFLIKNPVTIDLHGFCDACAHGYGACIYARSVDSHGQIFVKLICSKSRVAPLEKTTSKGVTIKKITIPRLELCAASLLKKLYVEVRAHFEFTINEVIFWSDSTIVLNWLKKAPHLLRTFEANRVEDIQSLGAQIEWRHVRSEDNPADALSRGQLPSEFINNKSWTSGPNWLVLDHNSWPPMVELSYTNLPGLKKEVCLLTTSSSHEIYCRFSNFERFIRVIAYILRWRNPKFRKKRSRLYPEILDEQIRIHEIINKSVPVLSCTELKNSEQHILLMIQKESFSVEFKRLSKRRNNDTYQKGTTFDNLHPFLDEHGLIRVGGRLKRSDLLYNQKHPIILPSKHHVTDLIIRQSHHNNLHGGVQSTLYAIRSKFWILNGKNQIRHIIRSCVDCIRHKPKIVHAQMADLPEVRIKEAPAFSYTGVDFFGPLTIKEKQFRNKTFLKAYGCVFVCMVSKAVHIELIPDLTSKGFLAGFNRFISRRGVPKHVFSDNGTNFVGANREIQEIYDLFETSDFRNSIQNYALAKRIEWHFNPPESPHFGGIWEAAVKSFKHHLKRVIKNQTLTYEQLNTLLIEIEAILNSRPLSTLSTDPNDPLAITPAHLLIGRPFNVLPETSLLSIPDNRLSTANFIAKARQDFWNKWHKEYLHELQTRQKWHESTGELKPGSVVILMDRDTACCKWPLGVILEVYPGKDDISRIALVKTANNTYKRNITRLCMLPVC